MPSGYEGQSGVAGGLETIVGVDVGDVGTGNNTTETVLHSVTLPANALPTVAGKACVRIRSWGVTAANAHVKTVSVKFGTSTVAPLSVPTDTGYVWNIEVIVIGDRVTQQALLTILLFDPNDSTKFKNLGTNKIDLTENGTNNLAIVVTGQNGTAAANDIVGTGLMVEYLNSTV